MEAWGSVHQIPSAFPNGSPIAFRGLFEDEVLVETTKRLALLDRYGRVFARTFGLAII